MLDAVHSSMRPRSWGRCVIIGSFQAAINLGQPVTYDSSNTTVATANSTGFVFGASDGVSNITVSSGYYSSTILYYASTIDQALTNASDPSVVIGGSYGADGVGIFLADANVAPTTFQPPLAPAPQTLPQHTAISKPTSPPRLIRKHPWVTFGTTVTQLVSNAALPYWSTSQSLRIGFTGSTGLYTNNHGGLATSGCAWCWARDG